MNMMEDTAKEAKLRKINNMQSQETDTIDLVELFNTLLDRWHSLLLCAMIGAFLLNAFSFFAITPTYTSTAKLYVVSSSTDSAVDLTDLNIGTSLTNDYRELIMSYPVMDRVIENLDLELTSDELRKVVTLNNPSNTRVLEITVVDTDPEMAQLIANTVAGVAQEYLPETMSTVRPNIAQVAKIASKKSNPSYTKYTLIGGILGFILMAAWLAYRMITDDTIHSAEDWEKNFDIPLLTVISSFDTGRNKKDTKVGSSKHKLRRILKGNRSSSKGRHTGAKRGETK